MKQTRYGIMRLPTPAFVRDQLLIDAVGFHRNVPHALRDILRRDMKEALAAGRFFYVELTADQCETVFATSPLAGQKIADSMHYLPYRAPWLTLMITGGRDGRFSAELMLMTNEKAAYFGAGFMVLRQDGHDPPFIFHDTTICWEPAARTLKYIHEPCVMNVDSPPTHRSLEDAAAYWQESIVILLSLHARRTEFRAFDMVEPSAALNRARVKTGKTAYAPYQRLNTERYITHISRLRTPPSEPQGGTHASPTPHLRRGHYRVYRNGLRIFIEDTTVRVPFEHRQAFLAERSHYELRIRTGSSFPPQDPARDTSGP